MLLGKEAESEATIGRKPSLAFLENGTSSRSMVISGLLKTVAIQGARE